MIGFFSMIGAVGNAESLTKGQACGFMGPLSAAPSSAGSVGVFGQRLFEFRGGLRCLQATRASFAGRPR